MRVRYGLKGVLFVVLALGLLFAYLGKRYRAFHQEFVAIEAVFKDFNEQIARESNGVVEPVSTDEVVAVFNRSIQRLKTVSWGNDAHIVQERTRLEEFARNGFIPRGSTVDARYAIFDVPPRCALLEEWKLYSDDQSVPRDVESSWTPPKGAELQINLYLHLSGDDSRSTGMTVRAKVY